MVHWRKKEGGRHGQERESEGEAPLSGGDLSPGDGRGARTDTGGTDGASGGLRRAGGAQDPVRRHGGAAALRAGHRQLEGGAGVPLPAGVTGV